MSLVPFFESLLLAVPTVGLYYVIVAFPVHTDFLLELLN